jgi:hypothetical protein
MRYGATAIIAVRSLVPALGAESECAPRRSAPRQTPLPLHPSNTSASVDPDVHIFAKGYLACFMDTTAEGLTFASFSANDPESEA